MADIITIDGPTSSGKNSVAHLFSQKINYQYLDSGSIYRCFSLAVLKAKLNSADDQKIKELLENLKVELEGDKVLINGEDVSDHLHDLDVTSITPTLAAKQYVRDFSHKIEHRIVEGKDTVIVGRAVGTELFPNAKLKFYLTAAPEVRAKRRWGQLKKKFPDITLEEVLIQLNDRDKKDMEREVSPLKIPEGAIVIDTTNLTPEESVAEFIKHYQSLTKF